MTSSELLIEAFDRIPAQVHDVVEGLTPAQLTFRLDREANSIAWLVWHMSRIADDHIAEVAHKPQVWTSSGWATRSRLPPDGQGMGLGLPAARPLMALRWTVSAEVEGLIRRVLRACDAMARAYAEPLDVLAVASVAHLSRAHFIRCFRAVFGETPHRYLQRRRVERSMFLLRETDRTVTDICFDVGFTARGPCATRSGRSSERRHRTTAWGMSRCCRPPASRWRPCGRWWRRGWRSDRALLE